MRQAVFLAQNCQKDALPNGVVWSMKFKTSAGEYVYSVDLTDTPQAVEPTLFKDSKLNNPIVGTKVLLDTIAVDGILFATNAALDTEGVYQECQNCSFLKEYTCTSPAIYKKALARLQKLESKSLVILTDYNVPDEKLEYSSGEDLLAVECVECGAKYSCGVAADRQMAGIHFWVCRLSFVED